MTELAPLFKSIDLWISGLAEQDERSRLIRAYRADVEAFLSMAQVREIESLGHRNLDAWKALEEMPLEKVRALADNFSVYREVCEKEMFRESPVSNVQLTWRFMRRLGLIPPSNLMAMLEETDVIEIYDIGFNQIFRNLNFFRVSSYTFEDLMHMPLPNLYKRPQQINELLFKEIEKVFSGQAREAFNSSLPAHIAEELASTKHYHASIEQRVMSPLFNSTGHVLGILASIDVRILESKPLSFHKPTLIRSEVFA